MTRVSEYRAILSQLEDWIPYLLANSGLPGPRGNLELAQAAVEDGPPDLLESFLAYTPQQAPANSPEEFLAFCGVLSLGKRLAAGEDSLLPVLRTYASDPRWRTREAVAMALQRLGDVDMEVLLKEMTSWSSGLWLEKRAVVAALAEPRLLVNPVHVRTVLDLFDRMTASIAGAPDRKSDPFQSLRKTLGYGWSVAAAALPDEGLPRLLAWKTMEDADIQWVVKENLTKKRLQPYL